MYESAVRAAVFHGRFLFIENAAFYARLKTYGTIRDKERYYLVEVTWYVDTGQRRIVEEGEVGPSIKVRFPSRIFQQFRRAFSLGFSFSAVCVSRVARFYDVAISSHALEIERC